MNWKRGTFEALVQVCQPWSDDSFYGKGCTDMGPTPHRHTVEGYVSGAFGIRKGNFSVTHLPSGRSCSPGSGGFSKLKQAKAYCEAITGLAPWSTITPEQAADYNLYGREFADKLRSAAQSAWTL